MNRLQKKCLVASVGMHGILAGVLIVGPGFFQRNRDVDLVRPITLVNAKIIDGLTQGGGDPEIKPVPPKEIVTPQPPEPAPVTPKVEPKETEPTPKPPEPTPPVVEKKVEPEPKVVPKPEPKVEKVEVPKPKPTVKNADLPSTTTKPKAVVETRKTTPKAKPEINLNRVKRTDSAAIQRNKEQAEKARQKALADAAAKRAREFSDLATRLEKGMSSGVNIGTPGPGGAAFVDYAQAVFQVYNEAWISPNDAARDTENVKAEVIVARDGRVISAKILDRSGNPALDKSVESVLDRVRKLPEFPEGASDAQRTFNINFNLKAKRLLG